MKATISYIGTTISNLFRAIVLLAFCGFGGYMMVYGYSANAFNLTNMRHSLFLTAQEVKALKEAEALRVENARLKTENTDLRSNVCIKVKEGVASAYNAVQEKAGEVVSSIKERVQRSFSSSVETETRAVTGAGANVEIQEVPKKTLDALRALIGNRTAS